MGLLLLIVLLLLLLGGLPPGAITPTAMALQPFSEWY
jgi:hypothetical protein